MSEETDLLQVMWLHRHCRAGMNMVTTYGRPVTCYWQNA